MNTTVVERDMGTEIYPVISGMIQAAASMVTDVDLSMVMQMEDFISEVQEEEVMIM